MSKRTFVFAVFFFLGFSATSAFATPVVLNFSGVTDGAFSSYVQSGFTVNNAGMGFHWIGTAAGGNSGGGLISGSFQPAAGGSNRYDQSALVVTENFSTFELQSFDLENFGTDVTYTVQAITDTTAIYSFTGTDTTAGWSTILVPQIDADLVAGRFSITVSIPGSTTNGVAAQYAIDNIQVNAPQVGATPEPGSLALLGTGMAGLLGVVRRRGMFASK